MCTSFCVRGERICVFVFICLCMRMCICAFAADFVRHGNSDEAMRGERERPIPGTVCESREGLVARKAESVVK